MSFCHSAGESSADSFQVGVRFSEIINCTPGRKTASFTCSYVQQRWMHHVSGYVEPWYQHRSEHVCTRRNAFHKFPARLKSPVGSLFRLRFTADIYFLVLGRQWKRLPSALRPFIWNWEAAGTIKELKYCPAKTRSSGFCFSDWNQHDRFLEPVSGHRVLVFTVGIYQVLL